MEKFGPDLEKFESNWRIDWESGEVIGELNGTVACRYFGSSKRQINSFRLRRAKKSAGYQILLGRLPIVRKNSQMSIECVFSRECIEVAFYFDGRHRS